MTIETQLNTASITPLKDALAELAECLQKAEDANKKQESVFVNISYAAPKVLGEVLANEDNWRDNLIRFFNDWTNNRVYTGEINANTTLKDVAGKIVLRIKVKDENVYNGFNTRLPAQLVSYNQPCAIMDDVTTLAPMSWGTAANVNGLQLLYQDASRLDDGGGIFDLTTFDGTINSKKEQVQAIVEASVQHYNANQAHNIWYMMDLGGYFYSSNIGGLFGEHYNSEGVSEQLTPHFFQYFNTRKQNASLGTVFMNFADNLQDYGAKYGCDYLIQTIIDNNFSFPLRTRPGTSTYSRAVPVKINSDPNKWD